MSSVIIRIEICTEWNDNNWKKNRLRSIINVFNKLVDITSDDGAVVVVVCKVEAVELPVVVVIDELVVVLTEVWIDMSKKYEKS